VKVTIITACRNSAPHLPETIESVLDQSALAEGTFTLSTSLSTVRQRTPLPKLFPDIATTLSFSLPSQTWACMTPSRKVSQSRMAR
jgi:hypothetical protein